MSVQVAQQGWLPLPARIRVLKAALTLGSFTVAQLGERAGVPIATVYTEFNRMKAMSLFIELGPVPSGGAGGPSMRFKLDPAARESIILELTAVSEFLRPPDKDGSAMEKENPSGEVETVLAAARGSLRRASEPKSLPRQEQLLRRARSQLAQADSLLEGLRARGTVGLSSIETELERLRNEFPKSAPPVETRAAGSTRILVSSLENLCMYVDEVGLAETPGRVEAYVQSLQGTRLDPGRRLFLVIDALASDEVRAGLCETIRERSTPAMLVTLDRLEKKGDLDDCLRVLGNTLKTRKVKSELVIAMQSNVERSRNLYTRLFKSSLAPYINSPDCEVQTTEVAEGLGRRASDLCTHLSLLDSEMSLALVEKEREFANLHYFPVIESRQRVRSVVGQLFQL
jgi:hypothetical protein